MFLRLLGLNEFRPTYTSRRMTDFFNCTRLAPANRVRTGISRIFPVTFRGFVLDSLHGLAREKNESRLEACRRVKKVKYL